MVADQGDRRGGKNSTVNRAWSYHDDQLVVFSRDDIGDRLAALLDQLFGKLARLDLCLYLDRRDEIFILQQEKISSIERATLL